jgi:hypothetical protein
LFKLSVTNVHMKYEWLLKYTVQSGAEFKITLVQQPEGTFNRLVRILPITQNEIGSNIQMYEHLLFIRFSQSSVRFSHSSNIFVFLTDT